MKALDDYNNALQKVYDYFGFKEDYVILPIHDRREMLWSIIENGFWGNMEHIRYAETKEKFDSDGDYYEDQIYTQRFYQKHIYRGPEFTLIFVDTHTDGMKYFAIYDNAKEVKS